MAQHTPDVRSTTAFAAGDTPIAIVEAPAAQPGSGPHVIDSLDPVTSTRNLLTADTRLRAPDPTLPSWMPPASSDDHSFEIDFAVGRHTYTVRGSPAALPSQLPRAETNSSWLQVPALAPPALLGTLLSHEALPGWSAELILLLGPGAESWQMMTSCRCVALRAVEDGLMATQLMLAHLRALTEVRSAWTASDEGVFSHLRAWCRFMDVARSLKRKRALSAGHVVSDRCWAFASRVESRIVRELDEAMAIATLRRHGMSCVW